jgi:cellulose synthase/poly-beta-1,6-N-acetylglucosamine synthase-like glycosyltransferase
VLVPLFKEERSIKRLVAALKNLDYPKVKLDIKFVLEANDEITINALKAEQPPQYMEIIRTPYSLPQTKPKACNYALNYARGEYVTIYDAEDEPDPQQLKKALAAFVNGGEKLACVQARLNYYNAKQNILTRWFSLEYATWFEIVMPGLQRINAPIPLGGTSNHIRTNVLKEIGGWDAFNVTEDADLGMRLYQHGYKCQVIDSITMEEAVSGLVAWFKQRTRWLKGFMQTYFVHMRSPRKLIASTGWRGFFTLQFFMGTPVAIYLTVPIWTVTSLYMELSAPLYAFALFNLFFSAAVHAAMAISASNKLVDYNNKKIFSVQPIFAALTIPLYGILLIFAAYRALYQLIFKPHYWDKTEHGAN